MLRLENSNLARGQITNGDVSADIVMNGQISHAADYKPLIVGYHNGAAVRLSDVADVIDSVQNVRAGGYLNGKRAVVLHGVPPAGRQHHRHGGPRSTPQLPSLEASIPTGINTTVVMDRTTTIRASVYNVERTLLISIVLVILVVFVFLRSPRATLIPAVAVPTFADRDVRGDVPVRVQPGQPVADGADDLDGVRGGRRDRGDGEHHAAHGGRDGAVCGDAARGARRLDLR